MIPLVGEIKELKYVKDIVVRVADKLIAEIGVKLEYLVGTMIEIPRAAFWRMKLPKKPNSSPLEPMI
jgi:pyruvate, orthophosphate dikinase